MRVSLVPISALHVAICFVILCCHGLFNQHALAGPFEEAQAAYEQQDFATVLKLMKPLAEANEASAQTTLASLYEFGLGVPQDFKAAAQWYRRAAEQGQPDAQLRLGTLLTEGVGVTRDNQQASIWLEKAAEQNHAEAQYLLALQIENDLHPNYMPQNAVAWYVKSADQNYHEAQASLGVLYQDGTFVAQDYHKAREYYLKAAEQGNLRAQNNLGVLYTRGLGVVQDYDTGFSWYKQAATGGYGKAMRNLGVMYDNGFGVEQSDQEAIYWYRKATEKSRQQRSAGKNATPGQDTPPLSPTIGLSELKALASIGNGNAQFMLGSLYFSGDGVPQDYVYAYAWFNLASSGGINGANEKRNTILARMTPDQINEAQELARQWQSRIDNNTHGKKQ